MLFALKRNYREIKWFFQRLFRGWSDNESWDLYYWICKRYLPVLKRLRFYHSGYPTHLTPKKWNEILDKIIYSFEMIGEDDFTKTCNPKTQKKIQEGCELFGKYFQNLWD